jgi:hypothetical protein
MFASRTKRLTGGSPRAAVAAGLVDRAHRLGRAFTVVDAGGLVAPLDAANCLEAELYAGDALKCLAVAAPGRTLAEPVQQLAVNLNGSFSRAGHGLLRS